MLQQLFHHLKAGQAVIIDMEVGRAAVNWACLFPSVRLGLFTAVLILFCIR